MGPIHAARIRPLHGPVAIKMMMDGTFLSLVPSKDLYPAHRRQVVIKILVEPLMIRVMVCTLAALACFAMTGSANAAGKTQMVKGTIKSSDASAGVLVVNQTVKDQKVDRELSIEDTTEFVVIDGGKKEEGVGKSGLKLLIGAEGAKIQVKCDKDVKVLKVTVTIK
jgi:hypothetical protein